jgi:hypothetical protein
MQTVYLETTVIGSIAGRLHPDAIIAARQQITRRWWATAASRYELFASDLVLAECSAGDAVAAAERMTKLDGIALLEAPPQAESLADLLIQRKAIPASEPRDAAHIVISTVNGIPSGKRFDRLRSITRPQFVGIICQKGLCEPITQSSSRSKIQGELKRLGISLKHC